MTFAEEFNLKREQLERFIGDRLVSLTMYAVAHDAVDALDRIVEERGRIMLEVNRTFGLKKEPQVK